MMERQYPVQTLSETERLRIRSLKCLEVTASVFQKVCLENGYHTHFITQDRNPYGGRAWSFDWAPAIDKLNDRLFSKDWVISTIPPEYGNLLSTKSVIDNYSTDLHLDYDGDMQLYWDNFTPPARELRYVGLPNVGTVGHIDYPSVLANGFRRDELNHVQAWTSKKFASPHSSLTAECRTAAIMATPNSNQIVPDHILDKLIVKPIGWHKQP